MSEALRRVADEVYPETDGWVHREINTNAGNIPRDPNDSLKLDLRGVTLRINHKSDGVIRIECLPALGYTCDLLGTVLVCRNRVDYVVLVEAWGNETVSRVLTMELKKAPT